MKTDRRWIHPEYDYRKGQRAEAAEPALEVAPGATTVARRIRAWFALA